MSKLNNTAFILNPDTLQLEEHTLRDLHKKYAYERTFRIREDRDIYGDLLGFKVIYLRGRIEIPGRDTYSSEVKAMEAGEGYLVHHVYENTEVQVFARREDAEDAWVGLVEELISEADDHGPGTGHGAGTLDGRGCD